MGNELSYEDGYYYSNYDDDDGVNRNNWADISQAALRREKLAQAAFDTVRQNWESRHPHDNDLPPKSNHVIPLLDPSIHLVEKVWKRFHKHVKESLSSSSSSLSSTSGAGAAGAGGGGKWDLKRRVASPEERKAFRITRKSKAYFVDAIYTVGDDCGRGVVSNNNNNNKDNQTAAESSQTAMASVVSSGAAAASSVASSSSAPVESKKRAAARRWPPGVMLAGTHPSASEIIARDAAEQLSKKPRRLQDLSNNKTGGGTSNKKKKSTTLQKKPAAPVVPQQKKQQPVSVQKHSFKYGDIVGIVNSSSPREVAAYHPAADIAAAMQYGHPLPLPQHPLAMVVCPVDPFTVRIMYPNQVQALVPIHHIQLVKPMPVMPPPPPVVGSSVGEYSRIIINNNNNVAKSATGK